MQGLYISAPVFKGTYEKRIADQKAYMRQSGDFRKAVDDAGSTIKILVKPLPENDKLVLNISPDGKLSLEHHSNGQPTDNKTSVDNTSQCLRADLFMAAQNIIAKVLNG